MITANVSQWEWLNLWNKTHIRVLERNNNMFIWSKRFLISVLHQSVNLTSNLFWTLNHKCYNVLPHWHLQWYQFRILHFQWGLSSRGPTEWGAGDTGWFIKSISQDCSPQGSDPSEQDLSNSGVFNQIFFKRTYGMRCRGHWLIH